MANRFDLVPRRQERVSSYVPLPLDVMMKSGAMKQQAFDKGVSDINTTKDLLKINSDPNRQPRAQELLGQYNEKISNLSQEYMETGDQSVLYKLNDLTREFTDDPRRQMLEASKLSHDAYTKDIIAAKKAGTYSDIKDYDAYKYDTGYDSLDNMSGFQYSGAFQKQDYSDPGQKLMAGIAKDGISFKGVAMNPDTGMPVSGKYGQYWKTNQSGKGVSENKALGVAAANAQVFVKGKGGAYFVDEAVNEVIPGTGHTEYNNLPDEVKDYVDKKATDYLLSIAQKQIGSEVSSGQDVKFLPDNINETLNKRMDYFLADIPAEQSGTDASVNVMLKKSSLNQDWKMEEGVLVASIEDQEVNKVVIKGKKYGKDDLPKGYTIYTDPTAPVGAIGESPDIFRVQDANNNIITSSKSPTTKDDVVRSKKSVFGLARRIGHVKKKGSTATENFAEAKVAVENYYKAVDAFNLRSVMFDVGTSEAITSAYKTTLDKDGNITDPGRISSIEIKNLDGTVLQSENLQSEKARIMSVGRILGPVQDLTGSTNPGDMYVESINEDNEPQRYIMNTGNVSINDALAPITNITKAYNNYISTGEKALDKEVEAHIQETIPEYSDVIVGVTSDKSGSHYYIMKSDPKHGEAAGAIPVVLKIDSNGDSDMMSLAESIEIMTENNMQGVLGVYNKKNYTKSTNIK